MDKKNFLRVTTYAAVFGLVGGMTFEGVNFAANKLVGNTAAMEKDVSDQGQQDNKAAVTTTSSSDTDPGSGVSDVAANVLPSIVAIDVTVQTDSSDFFGRRYTQEQQGSGSGIIVAQDEDNIYIATNNHVVADASNVSVKFNDESVYTASVKGTDSDSDLAVVEIPAKDLSSDTLGNIKVAALGDSQEVKIGEQAIAIGNALGYGTSVTVGYISAVDREVASEDVNMKLLQTDAAINPGNSGGALVNAQGQVIGINSAKYSDTQVEGMGFAIPVSTAVPIINDIVKAQAVPEDQQAYLGIRGTDVSDELSQYYHIPEGIYVGEISDNSPAGKGGMKMGDVITRFNGKDTTTMEGLQEKLGRCRAGDTVEVVVKRADNGEYKDVRLTVTLGKKTESSQKEPGQQEDSSRQGSGPWGGSAAPGTGSSWEQ